jgi:regulator of Ty1 transposition protein 103
LAKELEEEEYLLRQCIEKLKSVQGSRSSLVNQLKDALREQESELDNLKAQIQVCV